MAQTGLMVCWAGGLEEPLGADMVKYSSPLDSHGTINHTASEQAYIEAPALATSVAFSQPTTAAWTLLNRTQAPVPLTMRMILFHLKGRTLKSAPCALPTSVTS